MKPYSMYVLFLLIPCLSESMQLALPNNFEPDANEAILSALLVKQLLDDSKSIVTKCVNCVGKCLNCAAAKIKDLIWKKTDEPVEKFPAAIEAYASRKEITSQDFYITETTMNEKTYLIVVLQHDSQLENLKIEKNEDLGIFLYKEMNDIFVKGKEELLEFPLQETIVARLYIHWTSMTEARQSTAQLLITGHAIGGGLAQILGAYLKSRTENLLSNLKTEPKFTKMLKQTKVYTFSTPLVFLKKRTEELSNEWISLQKEDSYNFINNKTDYIEVKSKNLLRKLWDYFVSITPWSVSIAAVLPYVSMKIFISFWEILNAGSTYYPLKKVVLKSIWSVLPAISFFFRDLIKKGIAIVEVGLILSLAFTIIYFIFRGFEHIFQVVKNFFSKSRSKSIDYYSFETTSVFILVDQNFLEKQDEHAMCIDNHIKYFFSNTNFLKNFVQRKALPVPDQKKETAGQTSKKEEPVVLVQHGVENLVAVDGDKLSSAKKTNEQTKSRRITDKPSSLEQFGVIAVFMFAVIRL